MKRPSVHQASVLSTAPDQQHIREVKVRGTTGTYTVREFPGGAWHCTCLAWKNNHASPQFRHCKHTRQVQRGEAE